MNPTEPTQTGPVDSVLLIDGDNDPHLPPEFPLTPHTVVRVFLRPEASIPKELERKVGALPLCVSVTSPKGGRNAADFVMSLHAGVLHATLPLHVPFTLVTHDKSLAAMAQELQRIGRQALLWTSHPERGGGGGRGRSRKPAAQPKAQSSGRRRASSRPKPAAQAAPAAQAPAQPSSRSLSDAAAAYARRLASVKDPPGRLKTLLNDIKNRAGSSHAPEAVLEELKRLGALSVDENGRVKVFQPTK
ncbi:MAG TPA: hypothetical protein DCM05_12220 [Elusimicrobia bacterium]|nr:hypothetical protein [Elusimicrobiota bacterium]